MGMTANRNSDCDEDSDWESVPSSATNARTQCSVLHTWHRFCDIGVLQDYGTRTTVQWNGMTAGYRMTLLTTGYSLRPAAIARLFYAPESPDPPVQVTGKIGTGIPYRIPNYFNTGNPGPWFYFSKPCLQLVAPSYYWCIDLQWYAIVFWQRVGWYRQHYSAARAGPQWQQTAWRGLWI